MKQNQKLNVRIRINEQRMKEGKAQIFIRIFVDGLKTEIGTTHCVKATQWDPKISRVRQTAENAQLINAYLDRAKNSIIQDFLERQARGIVCKPIDLKNRFLGIEEKTNVKTILEAFDYHNLKMGEMVKIGKVVAKTLARYKITKNKVEAFMKHHYKIADKPLPEMRLMFVTEFEHYLLTVDNLQSNTAYKYIKNLKKIVTMSVGLDWIPSNPFANFRCSYTSPDRDILTQGDLDNIMNKEFEIERLKEVRDVFVFCCYTGFAYADVFKFNQNAVMIGLDGNYWLSTNRQKTGTKEKVPLLPIALEIIERYKNHPYCVEQNKLLPVNSNQRYNSYLKELADTCGINKHLTTHIARHTFATTVTLANGVPIETVSAMLGHTNIRTTQIYAKVVEKKMSEDMEILKSKLFAVGKKDKKVG
jgi:site-specific recombinase XerD